MVVLPLIIVSITLSIMKVGNLGSLGLKTIAYYTATTAIAVSIGIAVVTMLQPGDGSEILKGVMPRGSKKQGRIQSDRHPAADIDAESFQVRIRIPDSSNHNRVSSLRYSVWETEQGKASGFGPV